jgi:D-alanyl-lipoteichoic acid acyltransferase DltB (MBOAT superfamily)
MRSSTISVRFSLSVGRSTRALVRQRFLQRIAAPVVRAHELVAQLETLQPITGGNVSIGSFIFCGGLITKALLADDLAPLVDALHADPAQLDFPRA